jgi:hypothetical protein
MHLIIDADPIVYRCGFAAERSDYHLVVESPGGEISELHFTPNAKKHAGAQMRDWVKKHPKWEILDKQRDVHPDSKEQALADTRTQLQSIEKECRRHYGVDGFDNITIILSGPGNYRERLATIFPYKGNRDPEHKPYWYQTIRDYLTNEWGAYVVHGREADDECSILARRHRAATAGTDSASVPIRRSPITLGVAGGSGYCVATIDKDLDQIPGAHYNYLKQVFYAQSEAESEQFFYQQCLSGDLTDGVPGCWKIGETRAAEHIRRVWGHSKGILWESIIREYAHSQKVAGCPYVGRDPAAVALETARLVYLQQQEGELWIPDGPPHLQLEADSDAN